MIEKKQKQKKIRTTYFITDVIKERDILTARPVSPAGKVHLVTPKVNVAIREHGADLFKELRHERVGGVQDGVHGSQGARGPRSCVTGCEQICLA